MHARHFAASQTLADRDGIEKNKPAIFDIPHFLYFDSLIPTKRREQFKKADMGEWVGDESAKKLYDVWRKLKKRCQNKEKYGNIELANNNDYDNAEEETEDKTLNTN